MMVTLCSGSVCGSKFEQQSVTGFVISGVLLFFFAERETAAFLAPANFVARFFQFGERDSF